MAFIPERSPDVLATGVNVEVTPFSPDQIGRGLRHRSCSSTGVRIAGTSMVGRLDQTVRHRRLMVPHQQPLRPSPALLTPQPRPDGVGQYLGAASDIGPGLLMEWAVGKQGEIMTLATD